MDEIIRKLRVWGCDVEGTMERMVDDEEFYRECLSSVADDPYFAELGDALARGDAKAAFHAAHTLKGVLANVGLTPMYDRIVKIVEPLRAGSMVGLSEPYQQLLADKTRLEDILLGR